MYIYIYMYICTPRFQITHNRSWYTHLDSPMVCQCYPSSWRALAISMISNRIASMRGSTSWPWSFLLRFFFTKDWCPVQIFASNHQNPVGSWNFILYRKLIGKRVRNLARQTAASNASHFARNSSALALYSSSSSSGWGNHDHRSREPSGCGSSMVKVGTKTGATLKWQNLSKLLSKSVRVGVLNYLLFRSWLGPILHMGPWPSRIQPSPSTSATPAAQAIWGHRGHFVSSQLKVSLLKSMHLPTSFLRDRKLLSLSCGNS